jgi:flagellar biogenesis protein FliO
MQIMNNLYGLLNLIVFVCYILRKALENCLQLVLFDLIAGEF